MRSITVKAICTILVMALMLGLAFFVVKTAPGFNPTVPSTGGTSAPPSISSSSTTTQPTTTTPTAPTTVPTTVPSTTHSHVFIPEWQFDAESHWYACGCGEKTELAAHTDADLDEKCDVCGADVPLPHEHSFGADWVFDEMSHWLVCECGEKADMQGHTDTDTDGQCDICGTPYTPPHEHSFGADWVSDETNHWHACDCGEATDLQAHADTDVNGKCDVCDADVPLPHEHSFGTDWVSDETNHWHVCECGEKTNPAVHIDANNDAKCDVCTAPVAHEHSFGTAWQSDDTNHWHTCNCGEASIAEPHTDTDGNYKCDICKAALPEPPHEHSFGTAWESDEKKHWQVCACGQQSESTSHVDANTDHKCDVCAYVVSLPDPPKLQSHSVFIFDCKTNAYSYYSQELNKTVYPASVTKVFTCYVAMQYLTMDEEILLGEEQKFYAYDTAYCGFKPGDTATVSALLHGALMRSASDSIYGLAAAAGRRILKDPNASARTAVDAFMVEMNRQAQALGMGKTNFVTPDGYHDSQHYVSLHAFVIIARCAMNNPDIMAISKKHSETVTYKDAQGNTQQITSPGYNTLVNSNALVDPNSQYYVPENIGLKTGYTSAAGGCFLGVFEHNGEYVIIGIFGASSKAGRWPDMIALWNYYLELKALT